MTLMQGSLLIIVWLAGGGPCVSSCSSPIRPPSNSTDRSAIVSDCSEMENDPDSLSEHSLDVVESELDELVLCDESENKYCDMSV